MRRTTRFSEAPAVLTGEAAFTDLAASVGKMAKRNEYPYDVALTSKVKSLPYGGLLLDENHFLEAATDPGKIRAEVVGLQELGEGRKECSRAMVFGQLLLKSASLYEGNTHIAIKPFELPQDAVREANAFQFVNKTAATALSREGEAAPASLRPLGFCRFDDGMYGAVTQYDGSLVTYDNLFWNEDETTRTPGRVARALGHCGTAFGVLHGVVGAVHGDAQIKNWGSDSMGARYVDLDRMTFVRTPNGPVDPDQFMYSIREDLDRFAGSLTARAQDPELSYAAQMDEHFWPAYGAVMTASPYADVQEAYAIAQPSLHGDTI